MQEKTDSSANYFMMFFYKTIWYRKKSRGFGAKQTLGLKTSFTTYVTCYLTLGNHLNLPELQFPLL